jgi:TPR repeat protein
MAMYTLTLVEPDDRRRHAWLQRSAELGHPPAMLTLASKLLMEDPARSDEARGWLERAARLGFGPAAVELAECLDDGTCGQAAPASILKWVVVGRILMKDCQNRRASAESLEKRLLAALSPSDIASARSAAETTVKVIHEHSPAAAPPGGGAAGRSGTKPVNSLC